MHMKVSCQNSEAAWYQMLKDRRCECLQYNSFKDLGEDVRSSLGDKESSSFGDISVTPVGALEEGSSE